MMSLLLYELEQLQSSLKFSAVKISEEHTQLSLFYERR